VAVEVSLAHLDRPFDYLIDERDSAAARPGVRVRVRFAGRLVGGYVLARLTESEHQGRLGYLERVVSPEPVLTAEVADLARAVADRYAGTLADVLRLAVPPRHAKAEASLAAPTAPPEPAETPGSAAPSVSPAPPDADTAATPADRGAPSATGGWARYPAGPAFLAAVRDRRPARAVWQALPGEDWPARLADAAAVAAGSGRGALIIVPDARDLHRLDTALATALDGHPHLTLAADLGPAERYRRFLAIRRGDVRIVAGTRAAVFAPVVDLGLVAVFDDGDDLLAEPRAPYPHAREVLMMRSAAGSCALLVGGFARTAEAQLMLDSGWAHPVTPDRSGLRAAMPRIEAAGDDYATGATSAAAHARLSPAAFAAARAALDAGAPVLVQVPRSGYLPTVACARCRRQALCRRCHGPLAQTAGGGPPSCRWCGVPDAHFRCAACGFSSIRALAIGSARTAEEFGRAFPGVTVLSSGGPKVRATIPPKPAVVVATPGAEPVVAGGYGAALLLDGSAMLARPDLRAAEETLRRWMAAAALVRPAGDGGRVIIGADGSLPTVQAMVRWDPGGHATRELSARRELQFPPWVAMASIEGDAADVLAALDVLAVPPDGELLGPVELEESGQPEYQEKFRQFEPSTATADREPRLRALVRTPPAHRKALCAALQAVSASRSARKEPGAVRIRVDPSDLF
jgi:primosomal protein N' (replication factor Y)